MATQTDKNTDQQPSQEDVGYESSDWESEEETEEPEFLSAVTRRNGGSAMTPALDRFQEGKQVYVRGPRNTKIGPFEISVAYSDDTYDLVKGPNGQKMDKVKQRDLK